MLQARLIGQIVENNGGLTPTFHHLATIKEREQQKRKEKLRMYFKYRREGGPVGLLLIMCSMMQPR
jgi:hypothetical protein